jgi:Na+-transporting methylmalonyl-CoA/oxaloacetate decarboxylase beta subunit
MKISSILLVLLLSSFLLLLPTAKPVEEIELFPLQLKTVVINIQSAEVTITTSTPGNIEMTIFFLNPKTNSSESFEDTQQFTSSRTVEFDQRGHYQFSFLSGFITKLEISFEGLPITTLVLVSSLLVVWGIFYVAQRIIGPDIQ